MSTDWKFSKIYDSLPIVNGGRSSVGRAPDCDSGCRGFKSHRPPQFSACNPLKSLEKSASGQKLLKIVDTISSNKLTGPFNFQPSKIFWRKSLNPSVMFPLLP